VTATATIELPPFEPDKQIPLEPPPPPPVEPELPPRRTRRKKADAQKEPISATPQEAATPVITEEDKQQIGGLLAMGFGIGFGIIASAKGEHWNISKEEAQRLGAAWAEPLGPVLAANSKYVPWAVALLATSGIVMPRLQIDAKKKLENAENAQIT
jgi:hypothetical protein